MLAIFNFFHILAIFSFLGEPKKGVLGTFDQSLSYGIYKLNSKKPKNVSLIEYQVTRCYRNIALLLKYDDNKNINQATFHENMKIP